MLAADMQFVLLGSGEREYERGYRKLAERYPAKCAVKIGFDTGLSHRMEAGCDFYLMPSRFEPCGLNQMYSLRYGTPPIVRVTGGLDDSVTDISEDADNGGRDQVCRILRARSVQSHPQGAGPLRRQTTAENLPPQWHGPRFLMAENRRGLRGTLSTQPPAVGGSNRPLGIHQADANSRWPMNSPFATPPGQAKSPPPVCVTNWFSASNFDILSKILMNPVRGSRW